MTPQARPDCEGPLGLCQAEFPAFRRGERSSPGQGRSRGVEAASGRDRLA